MEAKEASDQAWIQRGRELRREQYTPLDSVNNPTIKMLNEFKSALKKEIQDRITGLENDEAEFSDEEVFFSIRECKSFLELIDTIKPFVEPTLEENGKKAIIEVLKKRGLYNPHNVFHHEPEFWPPEFEGYQHHIRIVKWNTKSTRVTMLHARFDSKRGWIIKTDAGIRRMAHGEKMR